MATINIDDDTAIKLAQLASELGMSVEAYVGSLVPRNGAQMPIASEDFDAELDALSFHGPSLPEDFSRADIYCDHD